MTRVLFPQIGWRKPTHINYLRVQSSFVNGRLQELHVGIDLKKANNPEEGFRWQ